MSADSLALVAPRSQASKWTVRDVYTHNGPFLWRSLQRLGVPESDLDDCLQEVLLVVHRRLDSYDPERAKLTTWLFGICLRVAKRSHRRHLARREVGGPPPEHRVAGGTPEDEYDRTELRAALDRALNAMDVEKRAALVFYEIDGMKTEAIAELMGVPVGTVHSRLHAARKQLWHRLEVEQRDPLRKSGACGAALGPLAIRDLLGEASPLSPMPHQVHLRALEQTAQLAASPGASLLTLLGGKALVGLVPAGMVVSVMVFGASGAPSPSVSATSWAEHPVDTQPAAARTPSANDRVTLPQATPVIEAATTRVPDSVLRLEDLPRVDETSAARPAPPSHSEAAVATSNEGASMLSAEAELVAQARRLLDASPAAALALACEYETRFPQGQLRSANEYLIVEALARLGRHSEARSEAAALAERDPQGLYSQPALAVAEREPLRSATTRNE